MAITTVSLPIGGLSIYSIFVNAYQLVGIQLGWIGLRSVPVTSALGYLSAMSTVQIPVPVPMLITRRGSLSGA